MPAHTFLTFLSNHGLIRLDDRPQWRTVEGGSRRYVERAISGVDEVLLGHAVVHVERVIEVERLERTGVAVHPGTLFHIEPIQGQEATPMAGDDGSTTL